MKKLTHSWKKITRAENEWFDYCRLLVKIGETKLARNLFHKIVYYILWNDEEPNFLNQNSSFESTALMLFKLVKNDIDYDPYRGIDIEEAEKGVWEEENPFSIDKEG